MAEPLHFSLSMQQAKASLQKALQKALQDDDDDDDDDEEDDDNHLVLPDAKKEFIIKEMKDTTSQASFTLPYQTPLECYCRRLRQHRSMALRDCKLPTLHLPTTMRRDKGYGYHTTPGRCLCGRGRRKVLHDLIARIVAKKEDLTWSEAMLLSLAKV